MYVELVPIPKTRELGILTVGVFFVVTVHFSKTLGGGALRMRAKEEHGVCVGAHSRRHRK